jgi:hypothetical protein
MLNAAHDQLRPRISVLVILSPFFLIRVFLPCTVRTRGTRRKCAWSEDTTQRFPSYRHMCRPLKLNGFCYQSYACDGSASVRLLVLLHVTFIPYRSLLLFGDLRFFLLGLLAFVVGGDHGALNLRRFPDRNRLKRKHDENTMQEPRGIQGVIYYEVSSHKEGTDTEMRRRRSSRVAHPLQARAQTPGMGLSTPNFVSSSVPSRSLPYVLKTSKI